MAAPRKDGTTKMATNKGAWTADEDRRLAEYIELHGAKRWKRAANMAGLNRCGKSCRLRWMNYLRPNIKRGNISDDEEDLILRLHKLLGNRWSLIAGRLPGRTDNEIKNYWNSRLSKKTNYQKKKTPPALSAQEISSTTTKPPQNDNDGERDDESKALNVEVNFDANEFFDFSAEGSYGLEWVKEFLDLNQELEWVNKFLDLNQGTIGKGQQ